MDPSWEWVLDPRQNGGFFGVMIQFDLAARTHNFSVGKKYAARLCLDFMRQSIILKTQTWIFPQIHCQEYKTAMKSGKIQHCKFEESLGVLSQGEDKEKHGGGGRH